MSILNTVLLIFINELDAIVEYTLRKSADDTQLEVADTTGCAAIQRDVNSLEKWSDGNS